MCLDMDCFMYAYMGLSQYPDFVNLTHAKFDKFSHIISSNTISIPFTFSSLSRTSILKMLDIFVIVPAID